MLIFIVVILFTSNVLADVSVRGYHRKDGTYVQPHHRSDPNHTTKDNWSTRGNINPYTGKIGTQDPEHRKNESNRNFNHFDRSNSGSKFDLNDHPLELNK